MTLRTFRLTFCLFLTFTIFLDAEKLKLVSDVWPPFTNHPGKTRTATSLVTEALSRGGNSSEMIILDQFTDVTSGIENKHYDGSAALWRSPEREAQLYYSEPYLENRLILVGRKGSDVSAKSTDEIPAGSKLGLVLDYAYGDEVTQATGTELIYGSSDQENLEKLLTKQIDYMLVDDLLISYVLQYQREDAAKHLQVGKHHLSSKTLHFAIRKEIPNASMIVQTFNEDILGMIKDGTYNRILKLKWIGADIDGDGLLDLVSADRLAGSDKPTGSYNVLFPDLKYTGESEEPNYYVNGKLYTSWNSIPEDFKANEDKRHAPPPVNAFNFAF